MTDYKYLDTEEEMKECEYGIGKIKITTTIYEYTKGLKDNLENSKEEKICNGCNVCMCIKNITQEIDKNYAEQVDNIEKELFKATSQTVDLLKHDFNKFVQNLQDKSSIQNFIEKFNLMYTVPKTKSIKTEFILSVLFHVIDTQDVECLRNSIEKKEDSFLSNKFFFERLIGKLQNINLVYEYFSAQQPNEVLTSLDLINKIWHKYLLLDESLNNLKEDIKGQITKIYIQTH